VDRVLRADVVVRVACVKAEERTGDAAPGAGGGTVMRRAALLIAVMAGSIVAGACGSDSSGSGSESDANTIAITLSDKGCEPKSISTPAGKTKFKVTNEGTSAVTEFEVKDGGKIIGEVENVIPGAEREFQLTLKEGTYVTECPGGSDFDEGTLEVTPAA
jgi:iron uptake system component EfeO